MKNGSAYDPNNTEFTCFEDWVISRMEFPPGATVRVDGMSTDTYELCLSGVWNPKTNSYTRYTVDSGDRTKDFPIGLCVVPFPRRRTEAAVHRDVAVMHCISEFHEAIEFVKLDGRRIADPHPDIHEAEHWDWLQRRLSRVMADYCKEFPPP